MDDDPRHDPSRDPGRDPRHDPLTEPARDGADDPVEHGAEGGTEAARTDAESTDAESTDALDAAAEAAIDPALLDGLAGQLVWRIGRAAEDAPVTVRVGLASAAPAFAELPRLRNATDAELRDAVDAGDVRVEWVGTKGR